MMNGSKNNISRDGWASGCLGSIVGWIGLGILTSVCFRLVAGSSFDPRDSVMLTMFRVDGGVLGAATGFAIDWFRRKEYLKSAQYCRATAIFVFVAYLGLLSLSFFGDKHQQDSDPKLDLIWVALPLLWASILLGCSFRLRKRASQE